MKPSLNLLILLFGIFFVGLILFNGNKYLVDRAVAPYEDSILVYKNEVKQIKLERNEFERNYIILESTNDSLLGSIMGLELVYEESLGDLNEVVDKDITLNTGEQQSYFDNRYSSDLVHTLHLDSIQGSKAINDIERGDHVLVTLLELQKIHVIYKRYALNAGMMISNREEMIRNLNEEIVSKGKIILAQEDEIKKLKRIARRQGFKTKIVGVAGVAAVVGVIILMN